MIWRGMSPTLRNPGTPGDVIILNMNIHEVFTLKFFLDPPQSTIKLMNIHYLNTLKLLNPHVLSLKLNDKHI